MSGVYISTTTLAHDDRGFRYGDGVFETVRVEADGACLWPLHMARLGAGLEALRIAYDLAALPQIVRRTWAGQEHTEGVLRITVSRGVGGRGYRPHATAPTLVVECLPRVSAPVALTLALSRYEKISPRALPTHIKTAQGLQSILASMEAEALGVDDVVLCDAAGQVSETSSANLFWCAEGKVYTPSLATGALAGVVREALLRLPVRIEEGAFPVAQLEAAEAVWATNVRLGVCPVRQIGARAYTPHHPQMDVMRVGFEAALGADDMRLVLR